MSTDADELELDSALAALDELGARRRLHAPRPPERRHHAAAITGRIHELAQEAYALEEARRARREEPSDRHPVLRAEPTGAVHHPSQEELIASLPWALRQHLVKKDDERDRPFVVGAMMGAAVAVITAITFVLVWRWSAPPSPEAIVTPIAHAATAGPRAGTTPEGPRPASTPALTGPYLPAVDTPQVGAGTFADPLSAAAVPLVPSAAPAATLAPKIAEAPVAAPAVAAAAPVRRPRAVKDARLTPKAVAAPPPAESELTFDDGDSGLAPVIAAAEEPGPPPPSQQDLDDAFEREFGVAQGAADGTPKRSVFVPPPVAEVPATLSEGEILQTVISHKAAVAGCVDAHTEPSDERRSIVLSWVIDPGGAVSDVKVASAALQGSALGRCMVDAVRAFKFAPHREAQPVRFPFSY